MTNANFFQPHATRNHKQTALTTSTTVSIPPITASSAALKTDLDVLSRKAPPTTNVQSSLNFARSITGDAGKQPPINDTPVASDGAHNKDHVYGLGITDDDKNDKANVKAANELQATAAQKHLGGDHETGTAKTAADTSKCPDESAGRESSAPNRDALHAVAGIGDRAADRRTGAAASSSSSSTGALAAATPAVPAVPATTATATPLNAHSNERRPSWRLKFDSGCKVCNLESHTIDGIPTTDFEHYRLR